MNYFFGFSMWKHKFTSPFFDEKPIYINPINEKNHLIKALKLGLDNNSQIYIWGKKSFPDVETFAHNNNIPIFYVEDGFIRSVGLGSDLTQPYSLVVDSQGIYFDPTSASDLEQILETHIFTDKEIERARYIRNYLVQNKLSKYNLYRNTELEFPKNKKIILVPGQVEDDASIIYGANGMSNLMLLQQVRNNCPDAYIIYKPHPDVVVGNRVGHVEETDLLKYCNQVVSSVSIDSILQHTNEVHTMTSLVGFEALLRGIHVVTYGIPFYTGWGLCEDRVTTERRTRLLNIDELVAAVYILYPRYIHPFTKKRCQIEDVLSVIDQQRDIYFDSISMKIRNFIIRKLQLYIRNIMSSK
jgi:capsular polysaccharide export protein